MIYVDEMLGTIAKWMVILGKNVRYIRGFKDDEIVNLLKPGDILITADSELCNRARKVAFCVFIKERKRLDYSLAYIFASLGEKPSLAPKFCPACGGTLKKVKKSEIKEKVPRRVYTHHRDFYICVKCRKIYWKGSHWKRIRSFYKRVLRLMKRF